MARRVWQEAPAFTIQRPARAEPALGAPYGTQPGPDPTVPSQQDVYQLMTSQILGDAPAAPVRKLGGLRLPFFTQRTTGELLLGLSTGAARAAEHAPPRHRNRLALLALSTFALGALLRRGRP